MPTNYVQVFIDRQLVDLYSQADGDIVVNYRLEDVEDFQTKSSSEALNMKFPATVRNDKNFNTFHDPAVEDMTPTQVYRSLRSLVIAAASSEIFVGKCILTAATHNRVPVEYQADAYGNNGDWLIALKEATLWDFLQNIEHIYSTEGIQNSWNFDGTREDFPYVYAPVRYGPSMDGIGGATYPQVLTDVVKDINMTSAYMKPSISCYWIIYWAFKSLGYKISSTFLDSPYFRRMVMPWTWGSFLTTDGTKIDQLKFVAKSANDKGYSFHSDFNDFVDLKVTNDTTNGGFDNGNVYSYDAVNKSMVWTYPSATDFGHLSVQLKTEVTYYGSLHNDASYNIYVYWYKNGTEDLSKRQRIDNKEHAGILGHREVPQTVIPVYQSFDVDHGDQIECKISVQVEKNIFVGSGVITLWISEFSYHFAQLVEGSTINLANYIALKNYKFLDFLSGLVDCFNLIIQTDPINKVVLIEPEYPYAFDNNLGVTKGGYFNGKLIDWNQKQDLSDDKLSTMQLFSDYERQLTFKFRDDSNDGILKTIQDRYTTILGTGTYVLPNRFKTDIKNIENRFFSPVMHYKVTQWAYVTTVAPQMVVMAPENIANTSASEAQNTFQPKLCYYKGVVSGAGGWKFNNADRTSFPFMFAVNYFAGGEADPVLSYSDEKISGVVAKGLLKKFYWQRMAIMRNGQYYTTFFYLHNRDVLNWFHREFIICRDQKWQLIDINSFSPLLDQSTECNLRKWAPVGQADQANTYPLEANVLNGIVGTSGFETKYYPLIGFASDIPQTDAPVELAPAGDDCVPFDDSLSSSVVFPDATVGVPYSYTYILTGASEFTDVTVEEAPSWMTVTWTGSSITFSGTPDAPDDGAIIELGVINACSDAGITTFLNIVNP